MKLTLNGLKEKEKWEAAGISLPLYDVEAVAGRTKESPKWVHFGAGNIFRIFIGKIADQLLAEGEMESGITCVETFDYEIIDKIYHPFHNLVLGITLNADGSTDKQVIGSLGEALKTTKEGKKRLREIIINKELQILSFTITEKGYALRGTDGEFFPWIQKDLENKPEEADSAMAVVCSLLNVRYVNGAAPLAIVSMDNCSHNGEILKEAILTIAKEWQVRGYVTEGFLTYLQEESNISFPWTMIDKITPRPAKTVMDELVASNIEDMDIILTEKNTYIAPFVNAEKPEYLVMEDKFPNGRPPFEKAGVYMTDRDTVNQVERMKVTTCLNPLHTALAVYGCILDYHLISEEMKDEELKKLVWQIGPVEGMEVVSDPGILSPQKFVEEVIYTRFPNPFMPDMPQRIATDTSQKVGIRFGETIKAYVKKYGDAQKLKAIPLAIAGWCRYLLGVKDDGNKFERSPDPLLEELTAILQKVELGKPETYHGELKGILSNKKIFGLDLYEAGIGEKIEGMFLEQIQGTGAVRSTLKKYL